jgi:hypothetical protein
MDAFPQHMTVGLFFLENLCPGAYFSLSGIRVHVGKPFQYKTAHWHCVFYLVSSFLVQSSEILFIMY